MSETFLILRRIQRDVINVHTSTCEVPNIVVRYSNVEFHKNSSSENRVVPGGRTETDRQTDMTKLIVALHNFANAPKNSALCQHSVFMCFVWVSEQTATLAVYRII